MTSFDADLPYHTISASSAHPRCSALSQAHPTFRTSKLVQGRAPSGPGAGGTQHHALWRKNVGQTWV